MLSESKFTAAVVEKAKSLGASLAGIADVEPLKESPSHRIYPKIGMDPEVPWQDAPEEALHHEVEWPADAVSAVVIGVEHPVDKPELDWYDGKGTPGNRIPTSSCPATAFRPRGRGKAPVVTQRGRRVRVPEPLLRLLEPPPGECSWWACT